MKIFTVHDVSDADADPLDRADGLVFIRDGFAVFAVISPIIWFIWHKLWIPLVAYIVVVGMLMGIGDIAGLSEDALGVLSLLLNIGVALEANNIRRWFLERSGAKLVGVASGDNIEECEYRFFSSWDDALETKGLIERLETA